MKLFSQQRVLILWRCLLENEEHFTTKTFHHFVKRFDSERIVKRFQKAQNVKFSFRRRFLCQVYLLLNTPLCVFGAKVPRILEKMLKLLNISENTYYIYAFDFTRSKRETLNNVKVLLIKWENVWYFFCVLPLCWLFFF